MARHIYSIGSRAPVIVNAIVEIPRTGAMTQKLEVDLATGAIVRADIVNPAVATHWHYGSIPETLGDEGEAFDVLIAEQGAGKRSPGDEIAVRPIGVLKAFDGWETRDDKIIAVPDSPEHASIRHVGDLPPVRTGNGTDISFTNAVEMFLERYKRTEPLTFDGWGDAGAAIRAIEGGQRKYRCVPLADGAGSAHVYPLYLHVFLPPPPRHFGPTRYIEDIGQVRQLFDAQPEHAEYGRIVSGLELKRTLRSSGHNISRSRLIGHDRERLIEERLRMADLLARYGVKVFTASNDREWLDRARRRGVVASLVDHESYEVENVAGISAQDLKTIQFRRADGTRVVIAETGIDEAAITDRLRKIGVGGENETCEVLNAPDRLIPWAVPARGQKRMTQLTNWIDYGFNIWPDRRNLPHLVIGEALVKIARFLDREHELRSFISRCRSVFEGVHILKLAHDMPYGSPTNSIDVGSAILCNSSLSDESRTEMEAVLQRPIDNSLLIEEDAPGLRCAIVPIDKTIYSILLEGDPLHHASVDRRAIDPLDPMDAFFDVHGPEHRNLAARVQAKREELRERRHEEKRLNLKRHGPVRG